MVTTAALVSLSDFSGVSLELNVSYLNPARDGDVAEVDARVLKLGGAVATMTCAVSSRASGRTVAEARHTKYLPRTEVAPQLAAMLAAAAGERKGEQGEGVAQAPARLPRARL